MPTTTKKENYTVEDVQFMHSVYNPEASKEERDAAVEKIMQRTGKGIRSVRAKLVNEKLYVKAKAVSGVTGKPAEKKEVLAQKLRDVSGLNLSADSLAKMNKPELDKLIDHFQELFEDDLEADQETSES